MHYIKDIFNKVDSEHAHDKFVRYSKGSFVGPLLKIKFMSSQIKVYASFHFMDELLELTAQVLGDKKVNVKGSLIWNSDLSAELGKLGIMYSKVTKARGIFKYALDNEVKMKEFVQSFNKYNLLLSIKDDEVSLVTKPNFPKPNKEFTMDFCKGTFPTSMADILKKEFLFDVKEDKIKEVIITHKIDVDDIEFPKGIDNFEEVRRLAKRIGNVERKVIVNGGEEVVSSMNIKI